MRCLLLILWVAFTTAQQLNSQTITQSVPAPVFCRTGNTGGTNQNCNAQFTCNFNGVCTGNENTNNCPSDCTCVTNGSCDLAGGETPQNCAADCPACNNNNVCDWGLGETSNNCASDCPCDFDGICETGEVNGRCGDCNQAVPTVLLFFFGCSGNLCTNGNTCGNTLFTNLRNNVRTVINNVAPFSNSATFVSSTGVDCLFVGPQGSRTQAYLPLTFRFPPGATLQQVDAVLDALIPPLGSNPTSALNPTGFTVQAVRRNNEFNLPDTASLSNTLGITVGDGLQLTSAIVGGNDQSSWSTGLVRPTGGTSAGIVQPTSGTFPTNDVWRAIFRENIAQSSKVASIRTQLWAKQGAASITRDAVRFSNLSPNGQDGLVFTGNSNLVNQVALLQAVSYIERMPSYTLQDLQQGLTNTFGGNLDRLDQNDLPLNGQYDFNNQGRNVNIYIVDNGVRTSHVDLNGRAVVGWSAAGTHTPNNHATASAGVAAGSRWGVAKRATIISVQAISGAITDIEGALNWVIRDITGRGVPKARSVVNLGFQSSHTDVTMRRFVEKLSGLGVPVVAPSGNSDQWACGVGFNALEEQVLGFISVGAMDHRTDAEVTTSNWGECVTLLAPAFQVVAPSAGTDTQLRIFSGTSYAAATTAGAVATMLQAYPLLSSLEIKTRLLNEAVPDTLTMKPNQVVNGTPRAASPNRLLDTQLPVRVVPPTASAVETLCGNGVVDSAEGETCDDNNRNGADGCGTNCKVEVGWSCSGTPSVCTTVCSCSFATNARNLCYNFAEQLCEAYRSDGTCPPGHRECTECGDGVKATSEPCDTGASQSGCQGCQIQAGFTCTGGITGPSVCVSGYTISTTALQNRITTTISSVTVFPSTFRCVAFSPVRTTLPTADAINTNTVAATGTCNAASSCVLTIPALTAATEYDVYCIITPGGAAGIQPTTVGGARITTLPTTVASAPRLITSNPTSVVVRLQTPHASSVTCGVFPSTTSAVTTTQISNAVNSPTVSCPGNANCDFTFPNLQTGVPVKIFCVPLGATSAAISPSTGLTVVASGTCACNFGTNGRSLCFNPASSTCVGYLSTGQCPTNTQECATCGDTVKATTEQCDVGAGTIVGCSNCITQPGFACTGGLTAGSVCQPTYSISCGTCTASLSSTSVIGALISSQGLPRSFTCAAFDSPQTAIPSAATIRAAPFRAVTPTPCNVSPCSLSIANLPAGITYDVHCALEGSGNEGVQGRTVGGLRIATTPTSFVASTVPTFSSVASTTASVSVRTAAATDVTCAAFPITTTTTPTANSIRTSSQRGTSRCAANTDCIVTVTALTNNQQVEVYCVPAGGADSAVFPTNGQGVLATPVAAGPVFAPATPFTPTSGDDDSDDDDDLSAILGAAIGGGVGGLCLLCLCCGGIIYALVKGRKPKMPPPRPPPPPPPPAQPMASTVTSVPTVYYSAPPQLLVPSTPIDTPKMFSMYSPGADHLVYM